MNRLLLTLAILSSCVSTSQSASLHIPVTPDNLDHRGLSFSIAATKLPDGVAFLITVSKKNGKIDAESTARLSIVTHTDTPTVQSRSIKHLNPTTPFTVKKEKRVLTTDFTVSNELLKKPGLSFVFTTFAHATIDGKRVAMPSANFYVIKLQDFLNN